MGDGADMALDMLDDCDEIQQRYLDTPIHEIPDHCVELLYELPYGDLVPRVYGRLGREPVRYKDLNRKLLPIRKSKSMPKVQKQSPRPAPTPRAKTGDEFEDRIMGLLDDDVEEGIKLSLYGVSGTGKTTVWATFPKPILALLSSGGMKPGEWRSLNTPEYKDSIKKLYVETPDDILKASELQGRTNRFKTIVLDHASSFQDLIIADILGLKEIPVAKPWGMVSQQQYGQAAVKFKQYLQSLFNLSCNIVIVAQEKNFKSEDADPELTFPTVGSALMPSLKGWLDACCDYVCQTAKMPKYADTITKMKGGPDLVTRQRVKGVEYVLRTAPHDIVTTKFRVPKNSPLPEYIVDPDYNKIMAAIRGEAL